MLCGLCPYSPINDHMFLIKQSQNALNSAIHMHTYLSQYIDLYSSVPHGSWYLAMFRVERQYQPEGRVWGDTGYLPVNHTTFVNTEHTSRL